MERVERSSTLAAPAPLVWDRALTPAGVNAELRPILRMTMPRSLEGMTIDEAPLGKPLGRSWIFLFGLIPVDYDELCLVELDPGRRFQERSKMLSASVWEHERTIEPLSDGSCRVTDRLGIELRRPLRWIPGSGRIARAIVGLLFSHRHRRLAKLYGAAA